VSDPVAQRDLASLFPTVAVSRIYDIQLNNFAMVDADRQARAAGRPLPHRQGSYAAVLQARDGASAREGDGPADSMKVDIDSV
jgi:hypothetical protein